MAAGREGRKGFSSDSRGIHWGLGERHESGTWWGPEEWERFVTWALENGAKKCPWNDGVEWCTPSEDPRGHGHHHRVNEPAVVWQDGSEEWWLNGIPYTDETFTVPYSQ
jgi:hypothetical protein